MPLYPPSHVLRELVAAAYDRRWPSTSRPRPITGFKEAILRANSEGRVALVAEYKRSSPLGPTSLAKLHSYLEAVIRAGAAAISVIAEPLRFNGSPSFVREAAAVCRAPVLFKGFVVKEEDVLAAYSSGADAVLLIARILADSELRSLAGAAHGLGLQVVVEVSTHSELQRALRLRVHDVLGVNSRDLASLKIDHYRALSMLKSIPSTEVVIYMSGIKGPGEAFRAAQHGANAILVGAALMKNPVLAEQLSRVPLRGL